MSRCRSCNAEIEWVKNHLGRVVPFNPEPDPNGNYERFLISDNPGVGVRPIKKGMRVKASDRRVSHHATCPDADNWRRS